MSNIYTFLTFSNKFFYGPYNALAAFKKQHEMIMHQKNDDPVHTLYTNQYLAGNNVIEFGEQWSDNEDKQGSCTVRFSGAPLFSRGAVRPSAD